MELWNEAFGADEPYYSWYFNNIYQSKRTYCLFLDEIMIASIQYAPRSLSLNTNEENIAYLVGVCTSHKYQHQGYGHSLLKFVINKLRSSYSLLMLNTDIPNYYQPLGFTTCYWLRQQKFTAIKNPSQEQYWQKGNLNKKDIKKYNDIYDQMTTAWDSYLIRDQQGWSDFFTDFLCDKGALYLSENAYLLWMIDSGQFFIKEIGYTTLPALEKTIKFAAHLAHTNGNNTFFLECPTANANIQ